MSAHSFISSRLRFKGKTAFWATAVSSMVMVVAVCVCSGMRESITKKILSKAGDALICSADASDGGFKVDSAVIDILRSDPDIRKITPVISVPGAVRTPDGLEGVLCKGMEIAGAPMSAHLDGASAKKLHAQSGGKLVCYFLADGRMKARNFTVVEISDDNCELGDVPVLECSLPDMRRLLGWDEGKVNGIELEFSASFKDPALSKSKAEEIMWKLYGSGLCCNATSDTYRTLYEWLDMINANVLAILLLMSIVAAFNMISALLILIMRSIPTIGTLKALGMNSRDVSRVFFSLGSLQALKGLAAGLVSGIAVCLMQKYTHFIKLDPSNYFVDHVPVEINIPEIVITGIFAWAVISAFLLIPCHYISKIDPVKTIKAD